MMTVTLKTCGTCQLFRPSPYNPEVGNGGCKFLEHYEAKFKAEGGDRSAKLRKLYLEIGAIYQTMASLCHPKADRKNCSRFKEITDSD
jgi:hypothetical protein